MSAPVIEFESTVVARRDPDGIAIALIDGGAGTSETACVAILLCSVDTARALVATVSSAIKSFDR